MPACFLQRLGLSSAQRVSEVRSEMLAGRSASVRDLSMGNSPGPEGSGGEAEGAGEAAEAPLL